jgi:hypothetical protein
MANYKNGLRNMSDLYGKSVQVKFYTFLSSHSS